MSKPEDQRLDILSRTCEDIIEYLMGATSEL